MVFWLLTGAISLIVTALILWPLLRKPTAESENVLNAGELAMQVYRDQLAGVEKDIARGVLSEDEGERTRVEISRRILLADKEANEPARLHRAANLANRVLAVVLVLVLIGGGVGTYVTLGSVGAPDLPLVERQARINEFRANRPSQEEIETQIGMMDVPDITEDYRKLVAQLRKTASSRPEDIRGQILLAQHEARLGDFSAARKAQENVIRLLGDEVTVGDWVDLAELMIIAADEFVSPEAETALARALQMDDTDKRARYYSGLDLIQSGRPDIAYNLWSTLLREGPEEAPWISPIRSRIDGVAQMAGLKVASQARAPFVLSGPTAAQINASGEMSAVERQDLIRSMVTRLSERLASEGGDVAEWTRLIRAYGSLRETGKAATIWDEAKDVFKEDPVALNELLRAAQAAMVSN